MEKRDHSEKPEDAAADVCSSPGRQTEESPSSAVYVSAHELWVMTELPPEEFGLVEVQDLLRIILWTHADSALEAARQLLSQGFDRDLCFVPTEAESGDWLCELVGDLCSGIIVALASGGGYSDGRLGLGAYALAKLKRWCPESALDGALGLLQQVRWADLPPFERRTVISAAHEIHRHLGWLWGVFPDPWACLKLEASPLEGATNSEGIDAGESPDGGHQNRE